MALTDTKILGAEVEAPAAVTPAVEAEVKEEVAEDFDPAILGSLSDKWAYVAAIADKTTKDTNIVKDPKTGKETKITTGKFIGYVFKALEGGLKYPQAQITPFLRKNPFKLVGDVEWKTAKKGEEVQLTLAEALGLASTPEINGVFTGGDVTVSASYRRSKKGANLKGDTSVLPINGFLKPGAGQPSLKDLEIRDAILVDKIIPNPDPNKEQFSTVIRKVAKGFERFAPACEQAPRKASTGATVSASAESSYKVQRNAKAAAFAKAFNARRG